MEKPLDHNPVKYDESALEVIRHARELAIKFGHTQVLGEHVGIALYDLGASALFDSAFKNPGEARRILVQDANWASGISNKTEVEPDPNDKNNFGRTLERNLKEALVCAQNTAASEGLEFVSASHILKTFTKPYSKFFWPGFAFLNASLIDEIGNGDQLREFIYKRVDTLAA